MSNLEEAMKFDVWCPDIGGEPEDARVFEAFSAEHAATKWADWHDAHSAEYRIVGGQDARVCVRPHGRCDTHEFMVYGEVERIYSANALPMAR